MSDSISEKKVIQWRTVGAIGAATWLVTTQLSGCAAAGYAAEGEGEGEGEGVRSVSATTFGGEGEGEAGEGHGGEGGEGEGGEGEGGEGEGGEGERAAPGIDFEADDVAYLTQLGLIRGHLAVGYALYSRGLPELAETHMKHPRAEIYSAVAPAFAGRGCDGFGAELTALTVAVTERQDQSSVDAAYAALTAGIEACEAGAAMSDPGVQVKVIEGLLRTAAIEYEIGIVDGRVNNLHEYQDAWGFTQVASAIARAGAFSGNERAAAVAAQIQDVIEGVSDLWPSLDPAGSVPHEAARLYGAAAQVQVASFGLGR